MKKSLGEIYLRIRITALSIATFVFLLTPPLAFADDYAQLEGCWQCQEDGESVTLEFKSRQQLLYNGEAYNYRLAPGVIQVQEGNNLVSYGQTKVRQTDNANSPSSASQSGLAAASVPSGSNNSED
jgi:hypothetical protein